MFNLKGCALQLACYSLLLLLIKLAAFTSATEQHDTKQDVNIMHSFQKSTSGGTQVSGKVMLAVVLLGVVPLVGLLLIAGIIILIVKLARRKPAQVEPQPDETYATGTEGAEEDNENEAFAEDEEVGDSAQTDEDDEEQKTTEQKTTDAGGADQSTVNLESAIVSQNGGDGDYEQVTALNAASLADN